jgi:predicted Zn-dependent protease with MMP-like domain
MEIHGIDTQTETPMDDVYFFILEKWPEAFVTVLPDTVLIYESAAAHDAWEAEGWTPENATKLVQLIGNTVVHEFGPGHWIWQIL